jgi:hypothetical protein
VILNSPDFSGGTTCAADTGGGTHSAVCRRPTLQCRPALTALHMRKAGATVRRAQRAPT